MQTYTKRSDCRRRYFDGLFTFNCEDDYMISATRRTFYIDLEKWENAYNLSLLLWKG